MLLLIAVDLIITLGWIYSGLLLAFLLVLAGLPEWLLFWIPAFFGCFMPAHRICVGYRAVLSPSRRAGRPDRSQPAPANQQRRRELPRLGEDLYP